MAITYDKVLIIYEKVAIIYDKVLITYEKVTITYDKVKMPSGFWDASYASTNVSISLYTVSRSTGVLPAAKINSHSCSVVMLGVCSSEPAML